jgi:hypothetical protein
VACGFSLTPMYVNVIGDFVDPSVTLVPGQGQQDKISWDLAVYEVAYQIQNKNTPAAFDAQTNFFYQLESGIEATLLITGAGGGYSPAVNFTPLRLLATRLDRPWLLTYNNGIAMSFQATVPLPFAVKVTVCFKTRTCLWPVLLEITGYEALGRLKDLGYVTDCFKARYADK